MTDDERKGWADQLLHNPLFNEMLRDMESSAIDAALGASNDETRAECLYKVRALRTLRGNCEEYVRNTPERKGAPA